MEHKKSKATDIAYSIKMAVWERDNHSCIYCGNVGYGVMPNAHFVPRSKGGLGIEQNIVTLCMDCHRLYDHGGEEIRSKYRHYIREYLKSKYSNFEEINLVYRKNDYGEF